MLSRFTVLLFGLSVVLASRLERTKRGAEHYTIEVVVAVDDKMTDYYGDELYYVVMTAMNLTSDVYLNSNLKQSISLSVLELIQLPFPSSDFEDAPGTNGKSAQAMLSKFCDYMKSTTAKYDAAILITRRGIYSTAFNPPSGINGLSTMGVMCQPNACLILTDGFLSTNWVAAHELGHTFGAEHDEDPSCDGLRSDHPAIMNASVEGAWNFSPCTQKVIDELLSKDQSKCLTEELGPNMLDGLEKDPNLFYSSRQCKELLGDDFNENAPYREEVKKGDCHWMWCPKKNGQDFTNKAPWANGSPCGKNKVCQHQKCVDE